MNSSSTIKKKALLLGSSGLIGGELLPLLLQSEQYDKIICPVRSSLGIKHPKLEEVILDFDRLLEWGNLFQVDDIFSLLGTTIKKAKTQEAYRKIDHDLPLMAAHLGKEKKASRFFMVSSIGADANSMVFMLRVKGELENELLNLWPQGLYIFRPSLLLGERKERRPLEELSGHLGRCLSPLMVGPLHKYRPILGKEVALAIFTKAQENTIGPSQIFDPLELI